MERIYIDDFVNYKFLSGIEYNSSGRYACFVVHQADMEDNSYSSNLWVYDGERESSFQLTASGDARSFVWLQDGEHLLFASQRRLQKKDSGDEQQDQTVFYKINIHGGEAREAFRIPLKVQSIKELGEGGYLVAATTDLAQPELYTLPDQEKDEELKARKEEKDYEVLEEIPYWRNGQGFTSLDRTRLYYYMADNGELEPITEDLLQVQSVTLNEDRTKALVIGTPFRGKQPQTNSLYILDFKLKNISKVEDRGPFSYDYAHFVSDDQAICCGSEMQRFGLNENPRFYVVDLNTGERTILTPDWDLSSWNSVGSDCRYGSSQSMRYVDGKLYFAATEGFNSHLLSVDLQGNVEKLTSGEGSVDGFAVYEDRILFIGLRGLALQEVYSLGESEHKVTDLNGWVSREKSVAPLDYLSVETAPGVVIDGWVMKPVNWEEGKTYPAILDIHGGPKTVYGSVFYHEMQYWANEGYFVLFCNPRGSDGKGNAFADIRGRYGTIDYEDIMAFTDEVLQRYPMIDSSRIGVTGGSYGGFMTNWIIGHTNRFKAAASQRSIANWTSMGWTTDIGYFFVPDQAGATPWNDIDKLWEQSPLKYADKVKTPTLFIHSEEDYRCWLAEGLQMFSALKYHGVESRLCMFRGENHELSRSGKPKHRIRRLREITEWFDKHLKSN